MVKTWVESNRWYFLSGMNLLSVCKTKGLWKKKTDKHAPERKEKEKMIQDQIKNPDLWDSVFL